MLTLAFRCWLLFSLTLGALGTPWWAVAGGLDGLTSPADATLSDAGSDGNTDSHLQNAGHDCHGSRQAASGLPATASASTPGGSPHGHDCDGALCDCGCVLPPLLIPDLLTLLASAAPPAPRVAARFARHAQALNTPFRPPIG